MASSGQGLPVARSSKKAILVQPHLHTYLHLRTVYPELLKAWWVWSQQKHPKHAWSGRNNQNLPASHNEWTTSSIVRASTQDPRLGGGQRGKKLRTQSVLWCKVALKNLQLSKDIVIGVQQEAQLARQKAVKVNRPRF